MTWPFAQVLEAWRVRQADRLFPQVDPTAALVASMADGAPHFAEVPAAVHDKIAQRALEIAIGEIGRGEEGGNNCGPYVARCVHPATPPQNWCAGWAGLMYELAAADLRIPLPFRRSLGAKRLGANVAAVGRKFTDPGEARPGDLAVWHRGSTGSWQGHVAIVESVTAFVDRTGHRRVEIIEGNSGPVVRRSGRHPTDPGERFAWFASLRKWP